MILTNYFIKQQIARLAEKNVPRERSFRGLSEVSNILLIYNVGEAASVGLFLQTLRQMGKRVQTLVYSSAPAGATEEEGALTLSPKTDLNLWGFPSDGVVAKFKSMSADLLIDLSAPSDWATQYLMLLHPCGFKVGAKWDEQNRYDLAIAVTERGDIVQLCRHILFYLQTIRSK